jgi:hypothetical protein
MFGVAKMRSRDLIGEYLAAMRAMTLEDAKALEAQGIPFRAIATVCPAPTRIRFTDATGNRYAPDPSGSPAYVFPVTVVDPESPHLIEDPQPEIAVAVGPIIDLVAISPGNPACWALRIGAAEVIGAVEPQYALFCDPVRVHCSVVGWLRAECQGVVILTQCPDKAAHILREINCIHAEDAKHKVELQALWQGRRRSVQ